MNVSHFKGEVSFFNTKPKIFLSLFGSTTDYYEYFANKSNLHVDLTLAILYNHIHAVCTDITVNTVCTVFSPK